MGHRSRQAGAIAGAVLCATGPLAGSAWAQDSGGDSELAIGGVLPILFAALMAVAAFVFGLLKLLTALLAPLTQTAEAFFAALAARDFRAAQGLLSDEFHALYDADALKRLTAELGIGQVRGCQWINRIRRGRCGYLLARLDTVPSAALPSGQTTLWILLIKRRGAWKLHALRRPPSGLLGYVTPAFRPQEPLP